MRTLIDSLDVFNNMFWKLLLCFLLGVMISYNTFKKGSKW